MQVEQGSLKVSSRGACARVPLEDIWVLIIESHQAIVTSGALSALCEAGIGMMVCGRSHHPNGLMLPLGAHSRHAAIVEQQLAISKPLKKQLWKRIVEAKIKNQATALDVLGREGSEALRGYSRQVRSGDATGRESVAAAYYFRHLLDDGSRRSGAYSSALDYGYMVLRAGVARSAVAGGWLVSRGIHHANELNAFNLVDDLIEPFRPAVDLVVVGNGIQGELDSDAKALLARVFECRVGLEGTSYIVQTAIDRMLESFKEAVLSGDPDLLALPCIIGMGFGKAEDR